MMLNPPISFPIFQNPTKRRRIASACISCRERKIKCDGSTPVCGACQRRGGNDTQPCEYRVNAGSSTASYQTGRDLGSPQRRREEFCNLQNGMVGDQHSKSFGDMRYTPADMQDRQEPVNEISPVSNTLNPNRAMGTLVDPFSISSSSSSTPSVLWDEFPLPTRRVADELLETYFKDVYVFYPWVHKKSFMDIYDLQWSIHIDKTSFDSPDVGLGGGECSPAIFKCALNAMFGLACEFLTLELEKRLWLSQDFYNCMKGLLDINVFNGGSLAHVQALLLVALYLQCTLDPKRCWNVVGMAYRMAVGLGLHLSNQPNDGLAPVEKEMRWRTWCACVQMDITASMIVGRPPMTPSSQDIPLPSYLSDEQLQEMDDQGGTEHARLMAADQFFYENMRLTAILVKILSKIYRSPDPGSQSHVDIQAILDIECALEDFQSTLDQALHWKMSYSGKSKASERHCTIIQFRFSYLKLLAYRPAFSEYCSTVKARTRRLEDEWMDDAGPTADSWNTLFLENCATRCVRAACNVVWAFNINIMGDAWWYGVYYLLTAGIILTLADGSGTTFTWTGSEDEKPNVWEPCLSSLYKMAQDVHPSAGDLATALTGLRDRYVPLEHYQGNQSSAQRQRHLITQYGNQVDNSDDLRDSNQVNSSAENNGGLCNALSPLVSNWGSKLGDIMLPARLLQRVDDGIMVPNLF